MAGLFAVASWFAVGRLHAEELGSTPRLSRAAFAAAFGKLHEGMAATEVERILGKPDDIRTKRDPGGISWARTREIWGYGTDGHLTFPVLGTVFIDEQGKVQYLHGTTGATALEKALGPARLDELLRLLARVTDIGGEYNPRPVIQAVNALQPLGKQVGCGVIREYTQLESNPFEKEGLFLVIRALFDVPPAVPGAAKKEPAWETVVRPGYLRPPLLGAPSPAAPKDPTILPRFPLALIDAIPLLVTHGYWLDGRAESVAEHLAQLEQDGTWRARPLTPPERPFVALADFRSSKGWVGFRAPQMQSFVYGQLLALIDTAWRPANGLDEREAIDAVDKLGIRWDSKTCRYTRQDGSCLPEVKRRLYQREIFEPVLPHTKASVILERMSASQVELMVPCQFDTRHPKQFAIRVYEIHDGVRQKKPVAALDGLLTSDGGADSWGCENSQRFDLEEGRTVQILCEQAGRVQESGVLKP